MELQYPIGLLCEIAAVSRSAYYKYKKRPLKKSTPIERLIIDIYHKTNRRAGYRTIKYILKNEYNLTANHKKVLRIMQKNGIQSIIRRKPRTPKPGKDKLVVKKNLLNRKFTAPSPGKKFVTDITYIPTRQKMTYLCTVIDLFNNEPVAWNVSATPDKNLSLKTVKTLAKKYDLEGSIIHSDRGVHYTNNDFVNLLEKLKVKQSMSRKGNCWDNAKAESFFSHFKCESIHLMKDKLEDEYDVKRITDEYMDYYINYRPQKFLGGMPPRTYKQTQLST